MPIDLEDIFTGMIVNIPNPNGEGLVEAIVMADDYPLDRDSSEWLATVYVSARELRQSSGRRFFVDPAKMQRIDA